jgi:hypothetical protein
LFSNATDLAPSELPPGLTKEEVTAKLAPPGQPPAHTKGVAGIVGLFVNGMNSLARTVLA